MNNPQTIGPKRSINGAQIKGINSDPKKMQLPSSPTYESDTLLTYLNATAYAAIESPIYKPENATRIPAVNAQIITNLLG